MPVDQAITCRAQSPPSFFGITFLVCKKGNLPSGETTQFPINHLEEDFLRKHYKPDVRSEYYYHPFKTSGTKAGWLAKKYPYSGSQSTRTRGHLAKAFFHKRHTDEWGWQPEYVSVLKEQLNRDQVHYVPAFWLAVWLYRSKKWPVDVSASSIIEFFLHQFEITSEEKSLIFDTNLPKQVSVDAFQKNPCADEEILGLIPSAPDSKPLGGGALRFLELSGVGPIKHLLFEPSDRLTIVTGDNGLGKTFLLECAWWCLTSRWAEHSAVPRLDASKTEPGITFQISGTGPVGQRKTKATYNWEKREWKLPKGRPTIPGLIVYARVDGSFAVWDPARHKLPQIDLPNSDAALIFTREEVLQGCEGQIEGLIRDWVRWQNANDQATFKTFARVLKRLSPPEGDPLESSAPVRLPGDPRDIPTLKHTYGEVPFIHESAGIRRIVTLAYLVVWAWSEHVISSALTKKHPETRVVILIDEMEAHLHPKWQREILPSILDIASLLDERVSVQTIVTTHSPLVLASIETSFDASNDHLYHLNLDVEGNATFQDFPFLQQGSVDDWLTSDIFELKHARSREGEKAIERAKLLLAAKDPSPEELSEVTGLLRMTLPPSDIFWSRWAFFLERRGIVI